MPRIARNLLGVLRLVYTWAANLRHCVQTGNMAERMAALFRAAGTLPGRSAVRGRWMRLSWRCAVHSMFCVVLQTRSQTHDGRRSGGLSVTLPSTFCRRRAGGDGWRAVRLNDPWAPRHCVLLTHSLARRARPFACCVVQQLGMVSVV